MEAFLRPTQEALWGCPANPWVVRRTPWGCPANPWGCPANPSVSRRAFREHFRSGLGNLQARTSPIKVSCWQPRSASGFYTAHTRGSLGLSGEPANSRGCLGFSGEPLRLYGEPLGLSGEPLRLSGEPLGLSASTFGGFRLEGICRPGPARFFMLVSTAEFSDPCAQRLLHGPHKSPPGKLSGLSGEPLRTLGVVWRTFRVVRRTLGVVRVVRRTPGVVRRTLATHNEPNQSQPKPSQPTLKQFRIRRGLTSLELPLRPSHCFF